MIQEKEIRSNWIQIAGESKENDESPIVIFLTGEVFINPEKVDVILNMLKSYQLNRKMNK